MKRYEALRIRNWRGYEILGQDPKTLNWERLVVPFDTEEEATEVAIAIAKRQTMEYYSPYSEIVIYGTNGYSIKYEYKHI